MKFSQRARKFWQMAQFMVTGQKATGGGTPFVFPTWGSGSMGIPSLVDYETFASEGYGKNAVVHACIREISRGAPSARLQVRRKLANAQEEEWESHKLQKLLNKPNKHQSQREFVELLYTYLNIDGNAFIIRERSGRSTTSLWLPRPDRMRPVVKDRDLAGYVYVSDSGEKIPWLVEEVIHIKEPNPSDAFEGLGRGLSPLAAAAVETDVDNRATKFSMKFFDNAAVPFGLLKSKNILDDAEVSRIRQRIRAQYSGEDNWHEIMILDADADYQRMGLDLTEMAFPDLRAISETRICATFKVPPILIGVKAGLDASTYSNYSQARRAMWEDKIIPDNEKVADKLSVAFGDELGPDGLISHDYSKVVALQEDRNSRFSRANQGVNGGWITVNEARREVGLGPVRGGDVFLRPLMSTAAPSGDDGGKATAPANLVKTHKSDGQAERDALGEAIFKRRDIVSRAWETRFMSGARSEFEREERDLLALLRKKKARKAVEWDEVQRILFGYLDDESKAKWEATFRPLITGLLTDQADEWADALGIDWSFENPQVRAFIERYSLQFADQIAGTTKEALRRTLIQAREEGWLVTQLITEVGRLYSGWQDFQRSEMIARSETIRASNAGAVEAYKIGGIAKKQWWASPDERMCEFCGDMHGQIIEVERDWFQQGQEMRVGNAVLSMSYGNVGFPPLHPDCRCTVLPVIDEEE